ncbi:MAG: glycoside hydrolase family 95 protein [Verrucomicrobiota bacterium]
MYKRFINGTTPGLLCLLGFFVPVALTAAEPLTIWFNHPATNWDHALPLGNGRLGAMVFGGPTDEHVQLNEDTLVSGYPGYRDLPLAIRKDYPEITSLVARHRFAQADEMVTKNWLGSSWACYQPLGDLFFDFQQPGRVTNYRRELDLNDALCRVTYEAGGVKFIRETFASHPDQIIVFRFTADKPGSLNFRIRLTSPHPVTEHASGTELVMDGQVPGMVLRRTLKWVEQRGDAWKYPQLFDNSGQPLPNARQVVYDGQGLDFDARLKVQNQGGTVTTEGKSLVVAGADEVVIIYSAASSYGGFDQPGVNAAKKADGFFAAAATRSYAELLDRHVSDYHRLFDRVTLDLGPQSSLPTQERLKSPDPALAALYFQFGRYLMIAGSRPGSRPLNLQGIWNNEVIPPWGSQYTLNINLEMNYWPAEVCNLSECTEPLFKLIGELALNGERVARDMYGSRGWVAHHNTTIWADAEPVDFTARTAFWPMAGGWLCQHLFEHYQFTDDRAFLRTNAYPLMKGAAQFYLDWLVDNGHGQLVTPVGISPENTFLYADASGKEQPASVSAGSTMDMSIIRDLFTNTIRASEILNTDPVFRSTLKTASRKLLPFQIGAHGQVQEWQEDFAEADPQHRHLSMLFGLYPGDQITLRGTPQLAAAARKSLERRGDGGTGWSMAWKISLWARLLDGDHAETMLRLLLTQSTLPNLLDVCPPFQIDGNFGATAGVAEMLLQSENGEIVLLPALPQAWPEGHYAGLRARGGFEVSCAWQNGRLTGATIQSKRPSTCRVRYGNKWITLNLQSDSAIQLDGNLNRVK